MALVKKQISAKRLSGLAGALVLLVIVSVYLLGGGSSSTSVSNLNAPGPSGPPRDVVIGLNEELFTDERFIELTEHGDTTISVGDVGRANPFELTE